MLAPLPTTAQDPAPPTPGEAAENSTNVAIDDTVAAEVDGQPIFASQVQRELRRVVRGRDVDPEALRALEAKTLGQLVDRRLIVRYLQRKKLGASEQDIDLAVAQLEKRLTARNLTVDKYCQDAGITPEQLRDAYAWQLGWQRYLKRYLTDENLERYFQQHSREFDGTQLRVAQIFWKASEEAGKEAARVHKQISDGKLKFAEAARQFSQAPSAAQGGDIGFIERHQPMPEPFSAAAFQLDQDQVSEPVATPLGWHLIQVLEVKPGERSWKSARSELEVAVTRFLFDWVASRERPQAKITYSGAATYRDPESQQLVVPAP